MSDDDKFGVCGLIWVILSILLGSAFGEWGFPLWLAIILTLAISLAISLGIYYTWRD